MAAVESSQVSKTGLHPWYVDVEVDSVVGGVTTVYSTDSSPTLYAPIVVGDTTQSYVVKDPTLTYQSDPYGAGWGINGIDHLVPINSGSVMMIYGNGDSRLFTGAGGTLHRERRFRHADGNRRLHLFGHWGNTQRTVRQQRLGNQCPDGQQHHAHLCL